MTLQSWLDSPIAVRLGWPAKARQSDVNQPPNRDEKDRRILNELGSPCAVDFDEIPVKQALKSLGDKHHFEIWFDEKAISDAGFKLDQQVNLKLSGVTVRSIFKLSLEPLALGMIVEDGVVKVTTAAKVDGIRLWNDFAE